MTWSDEVKPKEKYYWWKGGEIDTNLYDIEKLRDNLDHYIEMKQKDASINNSVKMTM